MRVLLDTCILSELQRPDGHPPVREAVSRLSDEDMFISALTVGEIAKGAALLPAGKKRDRLQRWLNDLDSLFTQRILPVDAETSHIWGEITASARKDGLALPAINGLIAATVLRHGLHLMTRNDSDFAPSGVMILNPWDTAD